MFQEIFCAKKFFFFDKMEESMSYASLSSIQKLKGQDTYDLWKFQVTIFMHAQNVFNVATGVAERPASGEQADEFDKKDAIGKKILIMTIDRTLQTHIMHCDKASDMWKKMNKIFEREGDQRQCTLMQDFFDAKYQKGSTIMNHISKLENIFYKLKAADSTITESMLLNKILSTLPENLNHFKTAWDLAPSETKTLSNLVSRLLTEEKRMTPTAEGEQVAFYSNKSNTEKRRCFKCGVQGHLSRGCTSDVKQEVRCFRCWDYGHRANTCTKPQKFRCEFCKSKKNNHDEKDCYFKRGNDRDGRNKGDSSNNKSEIVNFYTQVEPRKNLTSFLSQSDAESVNEWVIDSGCTTHMTKNKNLLHDIVKRESQIKIAKGENYMIADFAGKLSSDECVLSEVLYVPDVCKNLLSVNAIVENNGEVLFTKRGVKIMKNGNTVIEGSRSENGLFTANLNVIQNPCALLASSEEKCLLWHQKLGHLGAQNMIKLMKMSDGFNLTAKDISDEIKNCVVCVKTKQVRNPFNTERAAATRVLEIVHSDLCGPISPQTWDGYNYFITFRDDFSCFTQVYLLKYKSDAFEMIKEYIAEVESKWNVKTHKLRVDNGGEYSSRALQNWCKQRGLILDYNPPFSPQMGGEAERLNRTLITKGRGLLMTSNLPKKFWGEGIRTAAYLANRSPYAKSNVTPYEKWHGRRPNLKNLQIFGSISYAKILGHQKKLDDRSKPYRLVGYSSVGYRLWDSEKQKIIISRDVIFQNSDQLKIELPTQRNSDNINNVEIDVFCDLFPVENKSAEIKGDAVNANNEVTKDGEEKEESDRVSISECENQSSEEEHNGSDGDINISLGLRVSDDTLLHTSGSSDSTLHGDSEYSEWQPSEGDDTTVLNNTVIELHDGERRYPERDRTTTKRFPDHEQMLMAEEKGDDEPSTLAEALRSPNAEKWRAAAFDEYQSYNDNNTYVTVDRPLDKNVVKSKWVLKVKRDEKGNVDRYKARIVAKGFSQQKGIDYYETFAPVVRHQTVRFLIALASNKSLKIDHWDVSTAFLNGNLNEEVYMEIPEGLEIKDRKNKVWKLQKAVYGLKQASRSWNERADKSLTSLGFKRASLEFCVYYKIEKNSCTIIALFVDDFLILWNNNKEKEFLKNELLKNFKIKDLGKAKFFLGINIEQDDVKGEIRLNQKQYISTLLEKFQMTDCAEKKTPLEAKRTNNETLISEPPNFDIPYQNLIGSLMYLTVSTRPDLAYALSFLSQFNQRPTDTLWRDAKRVLRYLKHTSDKSLVFKRGQKLELEGYVDADWAADEMDRKSRTGFIFFLSGSAISWESRKQKVVSLSSTQAEYQALAEAGKEGIFLKNLFSEIFGTDIPVTIYCDNQGAAMLAKNPVFHNRSKHIEIKYHFIRELVADGKIILKYVSTDKMIADIMTKSLPTVNHEFCANEIFG